MGIHVSEKLERNEIGINIASYGVLNEG